jgi:HEXXH motif-containing protein
MSHAADYRRRRPHGLARTHESDYADGCVRRALAKAPADFDSAKITSHLTRWSDEHLDILGKAVAVLAESWPEAHDEMEAAVGEVFLLGGHGLVGFTDFVAHGAIFISDHQLSPRNGIGAEYLLAESLLHETTHTVCNAAATADPWIRKPSQGETFLVPTPLRADPRPLAGLAQQFVVLTRCSEFYWRVAGKGPEGLALEHRARSLSEQAVSAATTLRRFSANLTETGGRALEEGLIQLGRRAPDAGKV